MIEFFPSLLLEAYHGRRVLVTGASGLIGGAIAHCLAKVECRLTRLARRPLAPLDGPATVETIVGDIAEPGSWQEAVAQADVVFHLAAQTSVYAALQDPVADLRVNVGGLLNILEAVRSGGRFGHVVMAGTVTQAGLAPRLPVDETLPDQPITFYDNSKLTAEAYLKMYGREQWLSCTCLRLSNVYGSGPATSRPDRGVLDKVLVRVAAGETAFVYGDGAWLRDYIHIDDVVTAFLYAGAYPRAVNGRHFIIGSGVGISLKDAFALAIEVAAAHTGRQASLEHRPPPDTLSLIEFRNFVADPRAFMQATGWVPRISLRAGLEDAVRRLRLDGEP